MDNPYMSEEYTVEKLQEAIGWLESALENPHMTDEDIAECNKDIKTVQEAIDRKSCDHYKAIQAGYEDYEDMIYNRGEY